MLTGLNIANARLREEIVGEVGAWDEYYFGGLAPQRIHDGDGASDLHVYFEYRDRKMPR